MPFIICTSISTTVTTNWNTILRKEMTKRFYQVKYPCQTKEPTQGRIGKLLGGLGKVPCSATQKSSLCDDRERSRAILVPKSAVTGGHCVSGAWQLCCIRSSGEELVLGESDRCANSKTGSSQLCFP